MDARPKRLPSMPELGVIDGMGGAVYVCGVLCEGDDALVMGDYSGDCDRRRC